MNSPWDAEKARYQRYSLQVDGQQEQSGRSAEQEDVGRQRRLEKHYELSDDSVSSWALHEVEQRESGNGNQPQPAEPRDTQV